MSENNPKVIILAAGKGTRMKSELPKVLHPLCGVPMIQYVVWEAKKVTPEKPLVVIGYKAEMVSAALGDQAEYVVQENQLGTGHAIMVAAPRLKEFSGDLIVLYGDTPLISAETMRKLLAGHRREKAAVTVLTAEVEDPTGYGRIIRADGGDILKIVEEKDATEAEKRISEVNTGIYCFHFPELVRVISKLAPQNAQGEYYLTDAVALLVGEGKRVAAMKCDHPREILGPNDRKALAETERLLRDSILARWMEEGVTIVDPAATYIDPRVIIGADTRINPGTFLYGETSIGANCLIGPYSELTDCAVGNGSRIRFTVAEGAQIGDGVTVGPYAYLRPGTILETDSKVGDFVEVKNSRVGKGSKVPHLSYIGDCQIGTGVNIGAGTITCNYDGVSKHPTFIKDGAFIGSNTNLVAPVTVGEKALIGAGSTITKDVPDRALGIARSHQINKENWVKKD